VTVALMEREAVLGPDRPVQGGCRESDGGCRGGGPPPVGADKLAGGGGGGSAIFSARVARLSREAVLTGRQR
jgi:hypothetical protein